VLFVLAESGRQLQIPRRLAPPPSGTSSPSSTYQRGEHPVKDFANPEKERVTLSEHAGTEVGLVDGGGDVQHPQCRPGIPCGVAVSDHVFQQVRLETRTSCPQASVFPEGPIVAPDMGPQPSR